MPGFMFMFMFQCIQCHNGFEKAVDAHFDAKSAVETRIFSVSQ